MTRQCIQRIRPTYHPTAYKNAHFQPAQTQRALSDDYIADNFTDGGGKSVADYNKLAEFYW